MPTWNNASSMRSARGLNSQPASQVTSPCPADQPIGLLGGSFDPVHNGHLHIACRARAAFGLTKVVFMPAGQPPHKPEQTLAPAEDRFAMLALATRDKPEFTISRLEIDRAGPSFTVETLQALHNAWGPVMIRLILGADMLPDLHKWYHIEDLLDLTRPIIVNRPGVEIRSSPGQGLVEALRELLDDSLHPYAPDLAQGLLSVEPCAASSTAVRQRRRSGEPITDLVPEPVAAYIAAQELYSTSGE